MNELDDGRVVFFCGAGISISSGLPDFGDLVEYIYDQTRETKKKLEQDLIADKKYDKALGQLEGRLNEGRLRQIVIERLSKKAKRGSVEIHKSLLSLAKTTGGLRLITTNFDNRFQNAGVKSTQIDAAPKLPVPKAHNWHSLVHLHGRIISGSNNGNDLVLTGADFGRAYLTERWAARFISELFREFVVIFVGYSLDDPVMSYMVDALAAERNKGVRYNVAYAFGSFDNPVDRQEKESGWLGKSVEPILYHAPAKDHALLNKTLAEWARIRKDPFHARAQIAVNSIKILPQGANDPIAERVIWALRDPFAARALAAAPAEVKEAEFPKLVAWLDIFDQAGLLSTPVFDMDGKLSSPVNAVGIWRTTRIPPNLDTVGRFLCDWIARNLHVPQVLGWVVKRGAYLHPYLQTQVRRSLSDSNPPVEIPPRLRLLWSVLLEAPVYDEMGDIWIEGHFARASGEAKRLDEKHYIYSHIIAYLRPHLLVRPGPSSRHEFRRLYENDALALTPLEECGHIALVVDEGRYELLSEIIGKSDFLADYAQELTSHLELALSWLALDEEGSSHARFYRPDIAVNKKSSRNTWTTLINLARDSYLALANRDTTKAALLLQRWSMCKDDLFKRLTIYAVTQDLKADTAVAIRVLLAPGYSYLWAIESDKELFRFLRKVSPRLTVEQRDSLIAAIMVGPQDIPENYLVFWNDDGRRRRQIALRLINMHRSGIQLDEAAMAMAGISAQQPLQVLFENDVSDDLERQARWVGQHEFATKKDLEASSAELAAEMVEDKLGRESFEGVALVKLPTAIAALEILAQQGVWPASYWQGVFWSVSSLHRGQKLSTKDGHHLTMLLLNAPPQLFSDVGSTSADFIEYLAENLPIEQEQTIASLWQKAWEALTDEKVLKDTDILTVALNSSPGQLGEAARRRLWLYKPEESQGIPAEVMPYFEKIGADARGHLARVMLAPYLRSFFQIDPVWTERCIIKRMAAVKTQEAKDLWATFAWSATVGPNLLAAIRPAFVQVLQSYGEYGDKQDNLLALMASIHFDSPAPLTNAELKSIVDKLPEQGLVDLARVLGQRIEAAPEAKLNAWRTKYGPWLKNYWPQGMARNTHRTSEALFALLLETGEAFPDASTWAMTVLTPAHEHHLYSMGQTKLPDEYPEQALALLNKVIDPAHFKLSEKGPLNNILDRMKIASPDLAANLMHQRLYEVALG
jgi:hypothetical protein